MIPVTLDASVFVKWFQPASGEADLSQALALQQAYAAEEVVLYEPPHWRAEVAAVLARLSPLAARRDVPDLCLLDVETVDEPEAYVEATAIARQLSHHLFDTLYHAVAMSVTDCTLVTADERYFAKARHLGRIVRLRDWRA